MPTREGVRRRRRLVVVLILAVVVVYGVSGGCDVSRVSPGPSPEEKALLEGPPLPYSVAVVPWSSNPSDPTYRRTTQNPMAYARGLAGSLEASGAFRSVTLDSVGTSDADLLAVSTGAYCNSAVIPLFTGLTLGIVPTIFDDAYCVGARFLSPDGAPGADSVMVRFRYESRVIMGWLGVPVSLLPGWVRGSPTGHREYRDLLRLGVLEEREAIERLVGR